MTALWFWIMYIAMVVATAASFWGLLFSVYARQHRSRISWIRVSWMLLPVTAIGTVIGVTAWVLGGAVNDIQLMFGLLSLLILLFSGIVVREEQARDPLSYEGIFALLLVSGLLFLFFSTLTVQGFVDVFLMGTFTIFTYLVIRLRRQGRVKELLLDAGPLFAWVVLFGAFFAVLLSLMTLSNTIFVTDIFYYREILLGIVLFSAVLFHHIVVPHIDQMEAKKRIPPRIPSILLAGVLSASLYSFMQLYQFSFSGPLEKLLITFVAITLSLLLLATIDVFLKRSV